MDNITELMLQPAGFDFGFIRYNGPLFTLPFVVAAIAFVLFISFRWVYRDAKSRGKSGLLAVAFVLFAGWPLSFLWWFWLRPSSATPNQPPAAIPAA